MIGVVDQSMTAAMAVVVVGSGSAVPDPLRGNPSVAVVVETSAYRVTAAEVRHLNLLGFQHADWAYRVDSEYGSVAYSGDTVPCTEMVELARGVDVLVHEATFLEEIIEARAPAWTGHSGPRGAGRVAREA